MNETKYEGANWIAATRKIELSPLGAKVADILGQTFLGIYHLGKDEIGKVDWADDYVIVVKLRQDLATFDHGYLTRLVVLCHDAAIRMSIEPCNMRYLKLMFHQRVRDGGFSRRHPTIEDAIATVRGVTP